MDEQIVKLEQEGKKVTKFSVVRDLLNLEALIELTEVDWIFAWRM